MRYWLRFLALFMSTKQNFVYGYFLNGVEVGTSNEAWYTGENYFPSMWQQKTGRVIIQKDGRSGVRYVQYLHDTRGGLTMTYEEWLRRG